MLKGLDSGAKVLILAGVIALMVVANGVFAIVWTTGLKQQFVGVVGDDLPLVSLATQIMVLQLEQAHVLQQAWRRDSEPQDDVGPADLQRQAAAVQRSSDRRTELLQQEQRYGETASRRKDLRATKRADPRARRLIDELLRGEAQYRSYALGAIERLEADDADGARAAYANADAVEQQISSLTASMLALSERFTTTASRQLRRAETGLQHALATFTAGAVAIGAWMILLIRRINVARRDAERRLEFLAVHDSLTGLSNRRHFDEQLEAAIAEARRFGDPLCLCLCDLDYFKSINDEHGHAVGDVILRRFAELLRANVRAVDLAGRYGGDEFAIFFRRTRAAEAQIVLDRIRAELHDQAYVDGRGEAFRASATFGVAEFRPAVHDAKGLFLAADQALYAAKAKGRDRVEVLGSREAV